MKHKSKVKTVRADQGLSEDMIASAATRLSFSLPGEGLVDLREMYAHRPEVNTTLLYLAAKTYLEIENRVFPSIAN
jgi:hypothetical protein